MILTLTTRPIRTPTPMKPNFKNKDWKKFKQDIQYIHTAKPDKEKKMRYKHGTVQY